MIAKLKLTLLFLIPLLSLSQSKLEKEFNLVTHNINHFKAGNGFDDLQFLKPILKDKKIVGLGEATHGSKEFFQFKHRMFEFLVKEMDYKIFAFEANFSECLLINDYVLYGKGNINQIISGMYFWTWDTNEVYDLIKWMRTHNSTIQNDEDKVKFHGFDMQFSHEAYYQTKEFLEENAADKFTPYKSIFKRYENQNFNWSADSSLTQCLLELKNIIQSTKADSKTKSIITQNITVLQQFNKSYSRKKNNSWGDYIVRDSCMAINSNWIQKFENNQKMVLWAHNSHIFNNYLIKDKVHSMGYYLKKEHQDQYSILGFCFHHGGLRAKANPYTMVDTFYTTKPHKKSIDNYFYNIKKGNYFIDLKQINNTETPLLYKQLIKENKMQSIGALFNYKRHEHFYENVKVLKDYDGLIYFATVSAALPKNETSKNNKADLFKTLNCTSLKGKEIKFEFSVSLNDYKDTEYKLIPWLEVLDIDSLKIHYSKSSVLTLNETDRTFHFKTNITDNADKINIGITARGSTKSVINYIKLYVKENNSWVKVNLNELIASNKNEKYNYWNILMNLNYSIDFKDDKIYLSPK